MQVKKQEKCSKNWYYWVRKNIREVDNVGFSPPKGSFFSPTRTQSQSSNRKRVFLRRLIGFPLNSHTQTQNVDPIGLNVPHRMNAQLRQNNLESLNYDACLQRIFYDPFIPFRSLIQNQLVSQELESYNDALQLWGGLLHYQEYQHSSGPTLGLCYQGLVQTLENKKNVDGIGLPVPVNEIGAHCAIFPLTIDKEPKPI